MMKEKERELFNRWRKERNYPTFMADGLFDEETWLKQDLKILYVLKEANWVGGDTDLCAYLLSEPKKSGYWRTWNNITRWTQAIRHGGDYQRKITKADKTACMKTIAALNIKKIGGDAEADDEEIRAFGINDAVYINTQIELYQPDIIVCCGRGNGKNADILHDHVLSYASDWDKRPLGTYNFFLCTLETGKQIPVVSFRHPQMRGGHDVFEKYFNDMKEVAKGLRERGYLKI